MAWYNDYNRTTYIGTYKDEKSMRRDVEEASKHGWLPQGASGVGGHINVGRTVAPAVVTGGLSLLFGASRSKDKTTITFVRDDRWVARNRFDQALKHLNDAAAFLRRATDERGRALGRLKEVSNKPHSKSRESDETEIAERLDDVLERDQDAHSRVAQFRANIRPTSEAHEYAASVGADVPSFDGGTIQRKLDSEDAELAARIDRFRRVAVAQEQVIVLAREFDLEDAKVSDVSDKVAHSNVQLEKLERELASANPDKAPELKERIQTETDKRDAANVLLESAIATVKAVREKLEAAAGGWRGSTTALTNGLCEK